ncbi:hypothetical protein C1H76_4566 [Elsinoe australis]|uniref:Uncharacterized protein n=1 Tax=Elsinoe australis TaxID=40998 RepID=A0A4U7B412_9PEZI|nr:hypothetical protein C1H76_4566 [Elsinoe australis]
MTTAYSTAPMGGFNTAPWDRAVPQSDDSDASYNIPREQFRSLKSHANSDYYNTPYDSKRSSGRGSLSSESGRKRSIGSGMNQTTVDDSAWIHRDKLAQIESKEMQDLGFRVRRPSSRSMRSRSRSATRSASRTSDRRGRDSSQHASRSPSDAGMNSAAFTFDDMQNMAVPPVPVDSASYSRHNSGLVETNGFGFEDAPDEAPKERVRSTSRPGTSRIPVSRNSPAPLSNAFIERDSPLARSRNGSLALSSSPEMPQSRKMSRPRSQSLGSQMMLDEAGIPATRTPRSRPTSMHLNNSPLLNNDKSDSASSPKMPKSPKPGPLNPKKHTRNTSSATKPRVTSTSSAKDSPSSRPKSSGNRPRSVHRPEGEAPWIATMYKPDPMLPPDQQILPTHAKKIMQEQWAREGKTGDTYDKNFNLLNNNEIPPPKPRLKKQVSFDGANPHIIEPATDDEKFPAPWHPNAESGSREGSVTSGGGGGYKITPTIPSATSPSMPGALGITQASTEQKKGNRQSVYRLQTVGALPRENQVREDAGKGPAELDSHGGLPQIQPQHHAGGAGGDEGGNGGGEEPIVHKVDLEGLRRAKKEEKERERESGEKGAGCCGCLVM